MSINQTEIRPYPKIVIKSVAGNKDGNNIWYLLCKGELDLQCYTNELLNFSPNFKGICLVGYISFV